MLPALLVILDVATGRLRRARVRDWLRERAAPLLALGVVAIAYIACTNCSAGRVCANVTQPDHVRVLGIGRRMSALRSRSGLILSGC